MEETAAEVILDVIKEYGPAVVTGVESLVNDIENGKGLTVADVQATFVALKPYAAYKIQNANTANGVGSTITG